LCRAASLETVRHPEAPTGPEVPVTRVVLAAIYVAGLVFAEALRVPHRIRRIRSGPTWHPPAEQRNPTETLVMLSVVIGIWILPGIYIFTQWLSQFDYALPQWPSWPALVVFGLGMFIRFRAQVELGASWSPTIDLAEGHHLVTSGIYAKIRHPIYASLIIWALVQPVLLQNSIAGTAGTLAVALIWLVRVPAEEKMMRERFGEAYAEYANRTTRLIPRTRSQDA
jgi:protein-S-isoprenylcysteine O-methyltransferase Ste14